VTSPKRLEALPDVPTVAEAGFPKLELGAWSGLVASPSVPSAVIPRLAAEIGKVLAEPAQIERFRTVGLQLAPGTPEAFGKLIRDEVARWGTVIRTAKIKAD